MYLYLTYLYFCSFQNTVVKHGVNTSVHTPYNNVGETHQVGAIEGGRVSGQRADPPYLAYELRTAHFVYCKEHSHHHS